MNTDPNEDTIQDLTKFLIPWKAKGHELIIMIDANETLKTDKGG